MKDIKQLAIEAVEDLNSTMSEIGEEYHNFYLFTSAGWQQSNIEFAGEVIWTEDSDERLDIEGEKEAFKPFLLRESKKVLLDLNQKINYLDNNIE